MREGKEGDRLSQRTERCKGYCKQESKHKTVRDWKGTYDEGKESRKSNTKRSKRKVFLCRKSEEKPEQAG